MISLKKTASNLFLSTISFFTTASNVLVAPEIKIKESELGFKPPQLGDILTFFIRFFFAAAGLAALLYLLLGAFAWVTSGGSKENIEKARDKIQAAVVGVILVVVVLAIVTTLEKVVFNEQICFGLSCPLKLPSLLK